MVAGLAVILLVFGLQVLEIASWLAAVAGGVATLRSLARPPAAAPPAAVPAAASAPHRSVSAGLVRNARRRWLIIGPTATLILIAAAGAAVYHAISPSTSGPQGDSATSTVGPSATRQSSSAAAPHAGNLLPDPGAEQSPPGWTPFGTGILDRVDTSHSGEHALRVTTTATGPNSAGATSRPLRATTFAGRTYRASCWVRSSAGIGAFLQVQEYTKDWKRVTDPTVSPRETLADSQRWYQISVTHPAATTGSLLPVSVFSNGLRANGTHLLVDSCSLIEGQ